MIRNNHDLNKPTIRRNTSKQEDRAIDDTRKQERAIIKERLTTSLRPA
jgi:hypothetical protein